MTIALPAASHADGTWWRARTPMVTLYSQGTRDSVAHAAQQLDHMARAAERAGLHAPEHVRTVLIAFAAQSEFEPHRLPSDSFDVEVGGYEHSGLYGSWTGFVGGGRNGAMVMGHEYAHALIHDAFEYVLPCLNEGLAEYLSTYEEHDGVAAWGRAIPWHARLIAWAELLPADSLFAIRDIHRLPTNAEREVLYAESWALVHLLASQDGGLERLGRLIRECGPGTVPREAFHAVYPDLPWADLVAQMRAHLAVVPLAPLQVPLAAAADTLQIDAAPAGEVEAQVGLWRVASTITDPAPIARWFERALAAAPGLPLAYAGQGALALLRGRPEEALALFRAVAAVPAADAVALRVGGIGMIRLGGRAEATFVTCASEGEAMLKRALALDPHDALARRWLAHGGNPTDAWLAYQMGIQAVNAQHYAEAEQMFRHVKSFGNAGERELADQRIAELAGAPQYASGVAAYKAGKPAEALAWFRKSEAAAADSVRRREAHRFVVSLSGRAEYDKGIEALERHDDAAALAWFRKVRQVALSPAVRKMAAVQVARLEAAKARRGQSGQRR